MSDGSQSARAVERGIGQRISWPPAPEAGGAPFALAAALAHDLRSPIAAIQILATGLQEGTAGPVNTRQRRQLGVIRSAAISLCIIAADVEALARGKRYPLDGQPKPFSISNLFADVQTVVGPLQEVKGLKLQFDAPTDRDDHRLGYPGALRRVLINLTMNALQATDRGTVVVAAVLRDPRHVEFSVTDNGPGFTTQSLAAGLGLRICRDIVAALGSALEMTARASGGARVAFTIELPPSVQPVRAT